MRRATKIFTAFLILATAETLSLLMLTTAAKAGSIQSEVTPTATTTSLQTAVNAKAPETTTEQNLTQAKILHPLPNQVLDIPSTSIVLQFPVGSQVELLVNGAAVDTALIGRTETDASSGLVTQTWYGVGLQPGENAIAVQLKANGSNQPPTTVKVQVRGAAKQLKLQPVESRIPADGRSTATIQGQLLDANGNLVYQDAVITLVANAGEFVGADAKPDQDGFQVQARQGQFSATLRSGLNAQAVRIRAKTSELEAFTQLQFETNLRPSIVTGVVNLRLGRRGTDYHQSFREFLPPGKTDGTQLDLSSAVFGTGKIGEWLVTGAYNSDRSLNQDCNGNDRLFRDVQFCEQNYPVYGDSSQVEALTPSQDSLYLRLERSAKVPGAAPDYVMWGDYDTKELARTSQQFTATTRQLHGFKGNYNLGNFEITALYGNNADGFQRDAIAPDGTSGFYFLSRRLLVPGSENVFIELEELNRPGTVLQRRELSRGVDYEIDYDRGTLLFRQPLLRTTVDDNGQILVRRIVTTYQYENQGNNDTDIYAGRVQYNFSRQLNLESWLGATYFKEEQGVRDFELYGVDALISIGPKSHIIAEYAHSHHNSEVMGAVDGSAYRVEAEAEITRGIQGRAYLHSADTGFANNATISFVPGQTRYGAQLTGKVSPTTNLRLQYDHEDNRGIAPQPLNTLEDLLEPRLEAVPGSEVDNSLTTISAGVQQQIGKADLIVDWLHRQREDRIPTSSLNSTSDQLRSRLTLPLNSKLSFLAQNELTISNETDVVYPDRTLLGLNWQVAPDLNLLVAQQFYTRGQFEGNSITSVDLNGEHKFGTDTTLTGRYSILGGANGMTTQGAIGLNNRWTILPGLRLNLAYEHIFGGDLFGRTATGTQYSQPFAVAQTASALGYGSGDNYSVGLEYTDNPDFQASARFEHRNSSGGSNTVISAGVTGKISPALTSLLRYQQASASNQRLEGLGDTTSLKLGLAYRDPQSDQFNALLRYEYRKNPAIIPTALLTGSGTGSEDHTFALEALYTPDWRWEFYGKYAIRNSTSFLAEDLVGNSTTHLAQLRTTYRLGYSWDLVGEVRWINQPVGNYQEIGAVLEAGYYLTPNLRLSAGYAFGDIKDRDFDGSRSAGGPYVGLTVKLNELFNGFGLQKVAPPQQQESKTPVVASRSDQPNKLVAALQKPKTATQIHSQPKSSLLPNMLRGETP